MLYAQSLFIFRRDLRLEDNTGLISALELSKSVFPCFIFDPRQFKEHPYRSMPALAFMLESLEDLDIQLKVKGGRLYIFEGQPQEIIGKMIKAEKIDAVFVNVDYTPFSIQRDNEIEKVCRKAGVVFNSHHDILINPPGAVLKDDGKPYTIYTPYARKAMAKGVMRPQANLAKNYADSPITFERRGLLDRLAVQPANSSYPGGRANALKILKGIKSFRNYDQIRNIPSLDATTKLSAHSKFGTCSLREIYYVVASAFDPGHALIREIYWREFFTQIGFHFPYVLGKCFDSKYDKVKWDHNPSYFKAWCEGKTGFPIVDAGMRELNDTGFMHNRLRMITASFLIKDLHIDWRMGERYFAQKLVDYDPMVNNGNWQWAASTGCDAQPYFRIFNPWLQQEKFDPQAAYIKRWVPELKEIAPKALHMIPKKGLRIDGYPAPIVSHEDQRIKALARYQGL